MTSFNGIGFIEKKRDCGKHTGEELHAFVDSVMRKEMPDYQISAWLMAAFLNGLDDDELYPVEAQARGECINVVLVP